MMKYIIICLNLSLVLLTLCNAQSQLTAVDIIVGEYTSCPQGYDKIDKNLNYGNGGDYLYLCYSSSHDVSSGGLITGLAVVAGDSAGYVDCPSGYSKVPVDLNKGATGGKYIYLCYTHDPRQFPIRRVGVLLANVPPPQGWIRINQDLNEGAGGNKIYFIYTKN